MKCSNCQNEVNDNDKFCPYCGAKFKEPDPIDVFCTNCGHKSNSKMSFCSNCGVSLRNNNNNANTSNNYNPTNNNRNSFTPKTNNNFLTPNGRMNRLKYFVINLILFIPVTLIEFLLSTNDLVCLFIAIILLFIILPIGIIANIKRLHDINKSGWFSFFCFVPLANLLLCLILLFVKGTTGPNRFGPDPLQE